MNEPKHLWKLFTAEEEYSNQRLDKFNRHLYAHSTNAYVLEPMVSQYLCNNGLSVKYPEGKKFALCLTHDIDVLYTNQGALQQLRTGIKNAITFNIKGVMKSITKALRKTIEPDYHIHNILNAGKKYNAKSSFYFLSLTQGEHDFNYDPKEIKEIFELIKNNDGEIGLHGGHMAYNDPAKMESEKTLLEYAANKKVNGYRNHYLKFQTPATWEYLNDAGFIYDTTFGYADNAGFRNGMCHPFQPYSLTRNGFLDIFELPLVIMDVTLWRYMKLSQAQQYALCTALIDTVAECNGVLTLLWHNTQMCGYEGELYGRILEYANAKNAWMTSAIEIVDHWKANKYHEEVNEILLQLNSE